MISFALRSLIDFFLPRRAIKFLTEPCCVVGGDVVVCGGVKLEVKTKSKQ